MKAIARDVGHDGPAGHVGLDGPAGLADTESQPCMS